jgi:3-hydroxyacyl-[acyl-carrier-protein] dehydratase
VQPEPYIDWLPHRPPFRFLTTVDELQAGCRGVATWSVGGDESFFSGHFPGEPVVPGVLIAEALAQLSGIVASRAEHHGSSGRLCHVDVRFDAAVAPPAEIRLRSTLTRSLGQLNQFEVSASVGGRVVARGSLALMLSARAADREAACTKD